MSSSAAAKRISPFFPNAFKTASSPTLAFARKSSFARLRKCVTSSRNPFASRHGIEPAKLLVSFLASDPGKDARDNLTELDTRGEELHARGSELYIYYKNGMGKTKLTSAAIDKILNTPATARNWNTVLKLHEMAEALEE
jgi:uncharacterized protein (DUF1697 family)